MAPATPASRAKSPGVLSALIERQIEAARGAGPGRLDPSEPRTPPLNTKTAKFHRLIKLLQDSGPGLTIRQMASTLSVDERTVKRYLADLRRLKLDLVQEADNRGRKTLYRILTPGGPPPHLLSALKKIRSELHAGGNPKHGQSISQVIRYLEDPSAAPAPRGPEAPSRRAAPVPNPAPRGSEAPAAESPATSAEIYHIDHGPFAEADPNPGILKLLETSVAARTAVKITYSGYAKGTSPRPEAEEFHFYPYILCLRVGTLYLIGRQGEHRGPFKSLSVKRIRRCIATHDNFKPEPFNPGDYYKFTFGQWHRQLTEEPDTVLLGLKAPWLEKYLSESRFNPPGRIVKKGGEVCFELKVVIKPDFVNWVMSLIPDLVPLKPESLKAAVAERLKAGLGAI